MNNTPATSVPRLVTFDRDTFADILTDLSDDALTHPEIVRLNLRNLARDIRNHVIAVR